MTVSRMLALIGCMWACLIAGCTTINIQSADGQVSVQRHFGVLYVDIAGKDSGNTAQLVSFGASTTPLGFALGYSRQSWVQLPRGDCRLVLWVEDPDQLAAATRLANLTPTLCVGRPL